MKKDFEKNTPNIFFKELEKSYEDYRDLIFEEKHQDSSLFLFVGESFPDKIPKFYPQFLYRMNKIIQHRFEDQARPFKINVFSATQHSQETSAEINKENSIKDDVELKIFEKNFLPKFAPFIRQSKKQYKMHHELLRITFYAENSNEAYVWNDWNNNLPFWYRSPLNKNEVLEKVIQFLLFLNKQFFNESSQLDGHYLFKFIEGNLWAISPNISITPRWSNLHLSIKDIDFQIHVYHENQWLLDCIIQHDNSIIREQCYYDGTCYESKLWSPVIKAPNIDEDLASYIRDNFGNILKKIWDYSNSVYDVMEVIRDIIAKKLDNYYEGFYTLHSNFFNKTLQELKDSNPNKIVWDEKNVEKYSIVLLTGHGAKSIFNLITQIQIVDANKLLDKAINALTTIRLSSGSYDGKWFRYDVDSELQKVSPKFSTTPFWNNLHLDLEVIDYKFYVYLDNEWKFDIQINYKENNIKIFYKCFYQKRCNWLEYPMNLQERLKIISF